jgi:8-oxo-dGTP diphosphatase
MLKLIPVSIAIFIQKKTQEKCELWMQVRDVQGAYQGLWEFPGGKIEQGESTLEALIREVKEEVGITIGSEQCQLFKIYEDRVSSEKLVILNVFLIQGAMPQGGKWFEFDYAHSKISDILPKNHDILRDLGKYLANE